MDATHWLTKFYEQKKASPKLEDASCMVLLIKLIFKIIS